MKRVLLSILLIALLSSAAYAATSAFFSDTETSADNNFTAGRLDLKVNGTDNPTGIVNLSDLKPGDDRIVPKILYSDFNPAKVFLHLKDLVASQGAQTEPETVEENGTPQFDIHNYITYDLKVGDTTIISSTSGILLPDAVSCWIPLGTIPGATDVTVEQSFHFDSSVTDWAQGDMLTFTEEFLSQQINDPSVPVTGTGRVWDENLKQCVDTTVEPGEPFIDEVTSLAGTFGDCCDANNLQSSILTVQSRVTGAPDSPPATNFVQLSDNTVITMKFVNNKAVNGAGADIRIHIYDVLFPSSATIEIGQGPDCSSTAYVSAGTFVDTSDADIDLAGLGLSQAQCVRITDLVEGGDPFPTLGYDLDAGEALNSVAVP